jgi:uncharacterized protein (TIGR02246 family)
MSQSSDIEALYRALLESWNRRDAAPFGSLFDEDGHTVGFDGSMLEGRTAIVASLTKIFADHPTAEYVFKIQEVRFLGADAAMLRAIAGMVPRGQSEIEPKLNAVQTLIAEGGATDGRSCSSRTRRRRFMATRNVSRK